MAAAGPAFGLSSGGRLPWRRGCLVSIVRVRGLTAHLPDDVGVDQVGVPSIPIAIRPPARPLARPPSLHNGNRFCSYRMYAARPRSSTSSSFIYTYSLDQASGPTEVLPLPLPLLIHTALVLLRSSLCLFTIQTHILYLLAMSDVPRWQQLQLPPLRISPYSHFAKDKLNFIIHSSVSLFCSLRSQLSGRCTIGRRTTRMFLLRRIRL